ncbi:MAG: IPT/TIG domain-containing protein [Phocaeicola sp.]
MKRINKIWVRSLFGLTLLGALSFTACDGGINLETNQYVGGIHLNVFGPSPVARGGELRFLGSGMNQVTAIVIPGCGEVTDITRLNNEEIRITVPQTAQEGYVTLLTSQKEIVTKTTLTYLEPVSLESISPVTIKPGAILTISGEYLNLMAEVIFMEDVSVPAEEFLVHTRSEIQLVVPATAQSGKIVISDGAELPNWIYSDDELSVVLPAVAAPLELVNSKPGDAIVIEGTNLDLVAQVVVPEIGSVSFELNEAGALSFVLPEGCRDGELFVLPASGVEVPVASVTMAVPEELVAQPATEIKAGDLITIHGIHMELITSVLFPGVAEAVALESKTETEVTLFMPAMAQSGELQLFTASGKSSSISIETLKPSQISYESTSVPAGGTLTIQGENLELITMVTFAGNQAVEVTPATATRLLVEVPVSAESGAVVLTLANQEQVEAPEITVNKPECCYILSLPGEEEEIQAGNLFSTQVSNGDKLQQVLVNNQPVQYVLTGDMLHIGIPINAAKATTITLLSSNGQIEYTIQVIPAGEVETVLFTGPMMLTWGDGGRVHVPMSAFQDVPAGSILKIQFAQNENWGQVQFNNGSWANLSFAEIGGAYLTTDHLGGKEVTEVQFELTADILSNILGTGSGDGMVIQGSDFIINRISIVVTNSLEEVIMGEEQDLGSWSNTFRVYKEDMLAAGIKVGSVMRFYVEQYGYGQIQVNNANWGQWTVLQFEAGTAPNPIELEIDAALYSHIMEAADGWSDTGLVIQGEGMIIKRMTLQ